jgi:hypothetical protein
MSGNDEQMSLDMGEEAAKNDDSTVEVVVEADSAPAEAAPAAKEEDDVQVQLKKLQQKLDEERQARREAERRARDAADQANKAYSEVEDTNLQLVVNAIDTVRRENEILKSHYKEAMSVGDYDRAAEIQESMGSNSAKLLQLENGKAAMEARPRQQQVPSYSDPVEGFASRLSPRSAEWIRKNPQFVTDQRLQQKMIAAHNLAVADGYRPDSDEYFEFVEDTLKIRRQQQQEAAAEVESPLSSAAKVAPKPAPPAAPVNRSSSPRANTVRLSAAEAETAKMFGMTEKEYAQHKLALQREGKMN